MKTALQALMEAGRLPPLAYYFARFLARGCGVAEDGPAALAAALVSARNLDGDVCIALAEHSGLPLFPADADTGGAANPAAGSSVETVGDGGAEHAGEGGPVAPELADWLNALHACSWVGGPGDDRPLILDAERLYLGKYWHFESDVAAALTARMQPVTDLDRDRLAAGLAALFPEQLPARHPPWADTQPAGPNWQRVAAAVAVTRRCTVISGGPGTGKTTTVVKVLALLLAQQPGLRIALAAPTGKAAARLTESVGAGKQRIGAEAIGADLVDRIPEQAQTIHRLLGFGFRGAGGSGGGAGGAFRHDATNPLPLDCLVVDEASMVDLPLMARLLAALPEAARLVLLGDRDQLASVEAGNVLGDITGRGQPIRYGMAQIELLSTLGAASAEALTAVGAAAQASAPVPSPAPAPAAAPPAAAVALLRRSWRFGEDSGIGALACALNSGDAESAVDLLVPGRHADLARIQPHPHSLHPDCIDWAIERFAPVLDAVEPGGALDRLEGARVLAALHRGPFGVEALNARIAARLRELGRAEPGEVYHGMPVMVTANDYEVDLYNGDVGLLWRADDGRLRAYFRASDGSLRALSVRQLPTHVSAYALTVHKSQGSEFDQVLLVLPPEPHPLVSRELVYTGVTRARRQVTLHATDNVLRHACRARVRRGSALAERLGWPAPG